MIILSNEIPFTSWLSLLPRNIYNINSKVEINNLDNLKNTHSEQVLKDNELKLPHFLQKLNIPQTTYLLSFWTKSNILKYIFQPRAYNLTNKLSIGIFKCHYLHSNPTYQLQMNIYLRIIHLQHTQTFYDDLLFLYQWGMLVYREILRTYYMNDPLFT